MKYSMILVFLFCGTSLVMAEDNATFLAEKDDGSVAINYYLGGGLDTAQDALIAAGLGEDQVREIDVSEVPVDLEEDRDFWYWNPAKKKIDVDKAAKKKWEDDVEDAEDERDAIIKKMTDAIPGLTAKDLKDIGIKKDVKVKKEK